MDNERIIWEFLAAKIGNAYGVAGLMGNLYAESRLIPTNLQDAYERSLGMTDAEYTARVDAGTYDAFVTDAAGFGLAQWTAKSRKAGLMNLAWKEKKSIGDLQLQLDYIWQELQGGYKAVLATLQSAKTVREASDIVLTRYEIPRDQSETMKAKRASYGEQYFRKYVTGTAPAKRTGKEIMSADELIRRLLEAARDHATAYMYAAYGFRINDKTIAAKARQNLNGWYTPENIARLRKVANRTPPVWGFDCVNLLKAILWGWRADETQEYGGAKYGANKVPDTNADGMIGKCYDVSDDFSGGLIPGEGLWVKGHWGTYVGDGLAVECTTAWTRGVQVTAVHNLGKIAGYNGRKWSKHGKLPWIDYTDAGMTPDTPAPATPAGPVAPANPMTAPLFEYTRLLKRGSKGTAVKGLQTALNRLGYPCGEVDGDFGAKTEAAVRRFQAAAGIDVDGEFGRQSYAALKKRWGV